MTIKKLAILISLLLFIGCETTKIKKFDDCKSALLEKYCSLTENGTFPIPAEKRTARLTSYENPEIRNMCERNYGHYTWDQRRQRKELLDEKVDQACGVAKDDV